MGKYSAQVHKVFRNLEQTNMIKLLKIKCTIITVKNATHKKNHILSCQMFPVKIKIVFKEYNKNNIITYTFLFWKTVLKYTVFHFFRNIFCTCQ